MELERDGFAKDQPIRFDESMQRISFTLENRSSKGHQTTLKLHGLLAGTYAVSTGSKSLAVFVVQNAENKSIALPIQAAVSNIVIRRR